MTGILFSTDEEAEPFLARFQKGRFAGLSEGETAHDAAFFVTLIGTGKIKATLLTERFLRAHRPDRVLLCGTCTALSNRFTVGEIVGVNLVFEGDRMEPALPTYPRLPLDVPFEGIQTGILVTQDFVPASADERTYWQRISHISDMVGYAVAFVAGTHGIPCHITKVVAGHLGRDDESVKRTRRMAQHALADFLIPHLESRDGKAARW